ADGVVRRRRGGRELVNRGDGEVCLQRVSCDEDHVRQRNRPTGQTARHRFDGGNVAALPGQEAEPVSTLPAARQSVWRVVPAEGRAGAESFEPSTRRAIAVAGEYSNEQRPAFARFAATDRAFGAERGCDFGALVQSEHGRFARERDGGGGAKSFGPRPPGAHLRSAIEPRETGRQQQTDD